MGWRVQCVQHLRTRRTTIPMPAQHSTAGAAADAASAKAAAAVSTAANTAAIAVAPFAIATTHIAVSVAPAARVLLQSVPW